MRNYFIKVYTTTLFCVIYTLTCFDTFVSSSGVNNIGNQLDATISLLIIPISSTSFGQLPCPSSGALDCVLQLEV